MANASPAHIKTPKINHQIQNPQKPITQNTKESQKNQLLMPFKLSQPIT
jgi:hypothetical protein